MKDKLHWLAMHGVIRGIAAIGIRRGDLQARLIADPAVATDPVPFYDEVRSHGALVRNRANYLTVDHRLAHDLLRSDDFRVVSFGENLPPPLRWLERRTRGDPSPPARTFAAGRRAARSHSLPQNGVGGVHLTGGQRATRSGRTDRDQSLGSVR